MQQNHVYIFGLCSSIFASVSEATVEPGCFTVGLWSVSSSTWKLPNRFARLSKRKARQNSFHPFRFGYQAGHGNFQPLPDMISKETRKMAPNTQTASRFTLHPGLFGNAFNSHLFWVVILKCQGHENTTCLSETSQGLQQSVWRVSY